MAAGKTQLEFADLMKVTSSAVSGWEVGRNVVDPIALFRAATEDPEHRFSVDYVLLGDPGNMPHKLMVKIQQIERIDQGVIGLPRRGRPRTLDVTVKDATPVERPIERPRDQPGAKKRRA